MKFSTKVVIQRRLCNNQALHALRQGQIFLNTLGVKRKLCGLSCTVDNHVVTLCFSWKGYGYRSVGYCFSSIFNNTLIMGKDLILCNLRPGKVYLQEKWDVFIKKHRVSYIVIGSMPLFALIIGLVILISRHDVDGFMACTFLGVLGLLIFFGPVIIKYFRPKHYEISTLDGRLTIVENEVEALNTSIDSIKSIKFTIHQLYENFEE